MLQDEQTLRRYFREMKPSEELAFQYLSSLGLSPIIYEPDGNTPPDFLVAKRIAVEVRRLNQHEVDESGEPCGLETNQFALIRSMKEVLTSLGQSKSGKSWFVHFTFKRPILPLRKLKAAVHQVLAAFRDESVQNREFFISDSFSLELLPSSTVFPDSFVFGGFSDRDTGGFLAYELQKNIRICLDEKSRKISKVRERYSEWWLILVDHIGYGSDEPICVEHDWNKVVLLNPLDPRHGREI